VFDFENFLLTQFCQIESFAQQWQVIELFEDHELFEPIVPHTQIQVRHIFMKQASEGAESESGNIVYQRSLVQKLPFKHQNQKFSHPLFLSNFDSARGHEWEVPINSAYPIQIEEK